jgi:hypothetical protein
LAYRAAADAALALSAHASSAALAAGCAVGHAAAPLVLLMHAML